jgi:hypothetical protein
MEASIATGKRNITLVLFPILIGYLFRSVIDFILQSLRKPKGVAVQQVPPLRDAPRIGDEMVIAEFDEGVQLPPGSDILSHVHIPHADNGKRKLPLYLRDLCRQFLCS